MSDYKTVLSRAAKLCSAGERCTYEIKEKMTLWGMDPDKLDNAINYLVENNFINDERYAAFFVKDKFKFNKWGRIKIIYALRQKRIPSEFIEAALDGINQDEYMDLLDQIIETKINSVGSTRIAANKAKVLRFAAQKGFTSEEIFASIVRMEKNTEY